MIYLYQDTITSDSSEQIEDIMCTWDTFCNDDFGDDQRHTSNENVFYPRDLTSVRKHVAVFPTDQCDDCCMTSTALVAKSSEYPSYCTLPRRSNTHVHETIAEEVSPNCGVHFYY